MGVDEEPPPGDELSFGSVRMSRLLRLAATALTPGPADPVTRRRLRIWLRAVTGAAVLAAVAVAATLALLRPPMPVIYSGAGHGISNPDAIAVDDDHVWVANYGNSTVAEIDARTGALVRALSGRHVSTPWALATDGMDLWVASSASIDEFRVSDGTWIRSLSCESGVCNPGDLLFAGGRLWAVTMSGYTGGTPANVVSISDSRLAQTLRLSDFGLSWVNAIDVQGSSVWATASTLAEPGHGGLIQFDAGTGRPLRAIGIAAGSSVNLGGIVVYGTHLWVANEAAGTVVEISATTGAVERTLSAAGYGFNGIAFIQRHGSRIFAVNTGGDSVTEFDAGTGALVRVFSGPQYGFAGPTSIAFAGDRAWVASFGGGANKGSVTEFPVS